MGCQLLEKMDGGYQMKTALASVFTLCCTAATYLFGGWDVALAVLVSFMAIDYLTGVVGAIVNKRLSSQIGFRGLAKKLFVVLMLIVGVLLGAVITWCVPALQTPGYRIIWVAVKILMLPIICGVGYELLKWCGRHDNWLSAILSAPGKWLQNITTYEPDDSMIEVAIRAMELVIPEEKGSDAWGS